MSMHEGGSRAGWGRWLPATFLIPFLGLGLWSVRLVRDSRQAQHELDHCAAWNEDIARFRDAFESLHLKAASLLGAPHAGTEAAALEAVEAGFRRRREALQGRAHGAPDPHLATLDRETGKYADQTQQAREAALAWSETPPGKGKETALASARVAFAHLDHRRLEVLEASQMLSRHHQVRLQAAIQATQRNITRLSYFAALSLLVALAFAATASLMLRLKRKGEAAALFSLTLVDTLPEGLLVWNHDGNLLKANTAMARMTGHPSQALAPGIPMARILPLELRRRLESTDPGGRITFNLAHAGGRLMALEASMGVMEGPGGPIHLAVLRDVSRALEAERRLLDHRRMMELGQNMAVLCKDLQRVYQPVLISLEMLKRQGGSGPAWEQLDGRMQATSDLLNQIVRFANQDRKPEQSSTFDMNACVQEVVEGFTRQRRTLRRLDLDLSGVSAMVNGPRDPFKSSLELLIQRALDATGEGLAVKVRTWVEDGFHGLEILDSGDAIPASQIHRVFEPVYVTSMDSPGDGFSLFNVASTIQDMGGVIQADRLEGGWTRFLIQIPQA